MIEYVNTTKNRLSRKETIATLNRAIKYLKIKKADLSVVIISESDIKRLNKKYRKKDKATDVLSFTYSNKKDALDGEIIICYSIAKANAKKFGHSLAAEIKKLLIHSLLHLVGYDHKKNSDALKMEKLEERIIKSI
jgi:probable rRNA maturation factor